MQKLIRIRRKWTNREIDAVIVEDSIEEIPKSDQLIRIGKDEQQVYIDTPVEDFEERVIEVLKDYIPKNLAWSIKSNTIYSLVSAAVRQTVKQVIKEMKQETTFLT